MLSDLPGVSLANKLAEQGFELHVVKPRVPAECWPLYPALRLLPKDLIYSQGDA